MKLALTVLLLSSALALWGQLYSSGGPVVNNVGQPVAAQIAVCTTQPPLPNPPTTNPPNCSVYAATYTDATLGTPCTLAPTTLGPISGIGCTNPGKTDSRGNYTIFAAVGVYYLEFYGYGVTTYLMPISTYGGAASGTFSSVNGVINPTTYLGADIGAKINAAISANSCGTNNCSLLLPPGVYSFSTAITIPANTTIDCGAPGGWSSVQEPSPTSTTLTYTGAGDAITLSGVQSSIRNCSLTSGGSATSGIKMTAGQTTVSHTYMIGGGTSTKLVNINCGSGGCEKPELDFVDFYGYTGQALYCANSNDTTLTNLTGYAANAQITSVGVTVDSQCNGLKATRISFGGSGLHQIVFSDTLSTGAPTWAVFNLAEADCARGGAGVLFDSTLDGQLLYARFVNSWAAGSGQDCANPTSAPITLGAAGVDIAGGTGITIEASEIRANVGDGVLIHSASAQNIKILNSNIWGNNFKYRTFGSDNGDYNGVRVSTIANGLIISGNYFGNTPGQLDGHQHYGIKISATNPLNTVISANNFNDNTTAPYVYISGQQFPIIYGSSTPNSGTAPDNMFAGQISAYSLAAPINRPYIVPSYGSANNVLMGFGINGGFNGTNWLFPTDSTNNGGSLFLGGEDGSGAFYSVPTNTPASDQTVTPTNLASNNKMLTWNNLGQVSIPKFGALTSSTTNPATSCTLCFAKTDVLSWRNNANSGNLNLGINGSDQLTFNSTTVTPVTISGTPTTGKATCWKTASQIGYCSTQPDSTGACTCN